MAYSVTFVALSNVVLFYFFPRYFEVVQPVYFYQFPTIAIRGYLNYVDWKQYIVPLGFLVVNCDTFVN